MANEQNNNFMVFFKNHETGYMCSTYCSSEEEIEWLKNNGIIEDPHLVFPFEMSNVGVPSKIFCSEDPHQSFFDYWVFDDETNPTKIVVDLEAAEGLWLEELRTERDLRLEFLDKRQLQALVKKDDVEVDRLEEIKQQLRDLPENVDFSSVEQAEDIKDILPAVLFAR